MGTSSSPYFVLVDDKDANVTVIGTNVTASLNAYEEYDGTDITLDGENTEITLKFWGTKVQAYHTMTAGVPNTLSFALDDDTPVALTQPVLVAPGSIFPHYLIYNSSNGLPDGAHTLVTAIQTTGVTPGLGTAPMVLDYFIVTRPPEDNVVGLTLLYDDMHPDFVYTGQWTPESGQSAPNSLNMNWTLHNAASQGSTASLTFNGSSIKIFGSMRQNSTGAIASFSIDSEPPNTASVPIPAPSATLSVSANQVLYEKTLTPGSHSLLMTALASNMFSFDYLTVVASEGNTSSSAPSAPSNSPPATQTAASTNSTSPSAAADHRSSVGAIAGGVVGAVVAIALVAALLFIFFRRRSRAARDPMESGRQTSLFSEASPARPSHAPQSSFGGLSSPVTISTMPAGTQSPALYPSHASGVDDHSYGQWDPPLRPQRATMLQAVEPSEAPPTYTPPSSSSPSNFGDSASTGQSFNQKSPVVPRR